MAYKFSKGTRGLGDITFEDDADTGIDFEPDTIKLETGGTERVVVSNDGALFNVPIKGTAIGYTDGDEAITIEDGGYLKFTKGVVHSRGVDIGNSCGNYYNRWIKFAETAAVGDVYDTISSIFVITLCGQGSGDNRSIDGSFIVSVKYTADTASPYYRTAGTKLYVEAITSTDLAYTTDTTWDPADSIFMTMDNTALTGTVQLWFRSVIKDQRLFVSQICGTGLADTGVTDPTFITSTGQSWEQGASSATSGPWPEPSGLGQKIYGTWVSKVFKEITTTEGAKISGPLTAKDGVYVKVRDVSTTGNILTTDYVLRCVQDGAITLTLPDKTNNSGQIIIFKDINGNAGTNNITLDGYGNDTIDGSTTYVVSHNKEAITLICDGINGWMIASRVKP
jgi:hypothetical protein